LLLSARIGRDDPRPGERRGGARRGVVRGDLPPNAPAPPALLPRQPVRLRAAPSRHAHAAPPAEARPVAGRRAAPDARLRLVPADGRDGTGDRRIPLSAARNEAETDRPALYPA